MTTTSTKTTAATRIQPYEQVYGEILGFLNEEARLLDDDQHMEWLDLLTDDVTYGMPHRETYFRRDGRGFAQGGGNFDDTKTTLTQRARRNVEFVYAFDRDPAPRISRLVTNLIVTPAENDDEYLASSYVLLIRSQYGERTEDFLTARREDIIRRTPEGLRLAKRLILTNQVALSANYMNVFL